MSLLADLKVDGRFPPVEMRITPLVSRTPQRNAPVKSLVIDKFINYSFNNSMLIPVDNFSYSFSAPSDEKSFTEYVLEGDLVSLHAKNICIGTGIVDQIEIECDGDSGEKVTVNGRNLLGQLEDQAAVSIDMKPIYLQNIKAEDAVKKLIEGTRLPREIITQDVTNIISLIQTQPGETKLNAILRFLEPLNCLCWSSPEGRLVVGKPNFGQKALGKLMVSKSKRSSNVLSIRVTRSAASIASRVVAVWTSAELNVQQATAQNKVFENKAEGPSRLLNNGHSVTKVYVSSIANGGDAAGGDEVSRLKVAKQADVTLLAQEAFRMMARDNFNEILVTCIVAGHYNEQGQPYVTDTIYNIEYDRAGLSENMYLYSVEYSGDVNRGQWTTLNFCRVNTIVHGAKINA